MKGMVMKTLASKIIYGIIAFAVCAFVILNIGDIFYLLFAVFFTPLFFWCVVRILGYYDDRKRRRLEFYKEYEAARSAKESSEETR